MARAHSSHAAPPSPSSAARRAAALIAVTPRLFLIRAWSLHPFASSHRTASGLPETAAWSSNVSPILFRTRTSAPAPCGEKWLSAAGLSQVRNMNDTDGENREQRQDLNTSPHRRKVQRCVSRRIRLGVLLVRTGTPAQEGLDCPRVPAGRCDAQCCHSARP